jgi:hypothetical protein
MEDDNRRQRENERERERGRKVGRGVVRGTSCSKVLGGEGGETEHHLFRRFPGFARSSFW